MKTLLKHASTKVFGLITYLLILNKATLALIEEFLDLQFFNDEILHKSWFFLLKQDLLTFETLKNTLLSMKHAVTKLPIYDLDSIKKQLPTLFARIALSQNLSTS
jgi:hypothetical protein